MEKILQWSIANSQNTDANSTKPPAPSQEMLAQLFGGPDEPTLMKEAMIVITNPESTLESKQIAFENFEMLIENLDNANNIENLGLWEPLLSQLNQDIDSSLQILALWSIGTAVQNNLKSQNDLLKRKDSISLILKLLNSNIFDVKLKSLYALSNTLRHSDIAYDLFNKSNGWKIINDLFNYLKSEQEQKINKNNVNKLRFRIINLISSIFTDASNPEERIKDIQKYGDIINQIVNTIINDDFNNTTKEVAIHTLALLIQNGVKVSTEQKHQYLIILNKRKELDLDLDLVPEDVVILERA